MCPTYATTRLVCQSVMTYNIETHTGFEAFLRMCVWLLLADHTFQGTVAGFRKLCTETHTGFEAFSRMCVWPCVQTTRFKALWQGFGNCVPRHIQDLRAFCVCVSRADKEALG